MGCARERYTGTRHAPPPSLDNIGHNVTFHRVTRRLVRRRIPFTEVLCVIGGLVCCSGFLVELARVGICDTVTLKSQLYDAVNYLMMSGVALFVPHLAFLVFGCLK